MKITTINITERSETAIRLEKDIPLDSANCPPERVLEAYETVNQFFQANSISTNTDINELAFWLYALENARNRIIGMIDVKRIKKVERTKLDAVETRQQKYSKKAAKTKPATLRSLPSAHQKLISTASSLGLPESEALTKTPFELKQYIAKVISE